MAGGHLIHQGQVESRAPGHPGPNTQGPRWRPAWLAGIDVPTLNQVRSDWTFYDSVGTLVGALCILSGISAAIAVGYVVGKPAVNLWWFGAIWTGIVVCVERVILQVPGSRDWLSSLGSLLWRASLSVLLAFLLTEPIIMLFHHREIDAQLNHNTGVAIEEEFHTIDADFKPQFKDAHVELRNTRNRKRELKKKLAKDQERRATAEEHGLTGAVLANIGYEKLHRDGLAAATERNERWQPELHRKLANLAAAKGAKKEEAKREIEEGNGFEARVKALADVQAKWPSTEYAIWALRLVFLILDLTPLVSTLAYRRRPGAQPYEERRAAAWEWDSLASQKVQEAVRVEKQRIREEARSEMRVNQARIAADTERRIYGMAGDDPPTFSNADPVAAMSFDEFVESIEHYEYRAVDVPDELRRSALIGLGLIVLTTLVGFLWASATASTLAGGWLLAVALGLAVALCVYSRGFSRAPAWAMRPILAVFIGGLVSPLFIAMVNA